MAGPTPIFDYAFDTPWLVTEPIERAMAGARDAGAPVGEALVHAEIDELRSNPEYRRRYREIYRDAGVDVLSVTLGSRVDPDIPPADAVWFDLARWQARFDAVDWLENVTRPDDMVRCAAEESVGILLNTQNLGAAIDGDENRVRELYDAGVRVMQLTYNRQNLIGTGCTDYSNGGLSAHGRSVVDRINALGAVLDLSHCNRPTTMDAIEASSDPVAFTHTSCAGVAEHARAKTDRELGALAETDGYVGIVAIPTFLAPERTDPPLETFFEHIDYAVRTVGADRVGIGTDFANLDEDVPDDLLPEVRAGAEESLFREEHRAAVGLGTGFGPFRSYTDWNVIQEGIYDRYDTEVAEGILGGNFQRFFERVVG